MESVIGFCPSMVFIHPADFFKQVFRDREIGRRRFHYLLTHIGQYMSYSANNVLLGWIDILLTL